MKQVCGVWFPESDTHFKLGMIDEQGNYQKDIFDTAISYVKEPKIFYDIGAHVGLWSLMAHRAGFKKIEAYEPNLKTYECLEKNLDNKDIKRFLWAHGVSEELRFVEIVEVDINNSGAVTIKKLPRKEGSGPFVKPINNKHLHWDIELYDIKPHECLVKIDTEGMEADCVLGMDKILYALRPVVCVEQRTNHDALKILQQMGMKVVQQVRKDYILTWKNQ